MGGRMSPEYHANYRAQWRQDFEAASDDRCLWCGTCQRWRLKSEFTAGSVRRCRDCQRAKNSRYAAVPENRKKKRENAANWKAENHARAKENYRARHLREFGLTPTLYDEMLKAQNGVCAICGKPCKSGRRLAIDHNHKTGAIRELLCGNCNTGFGFTKENPLIILRMLGYALKHNGGSVESNELIERIAKAMYGTMAHVYDWELARDDHKEIYRKEARAAVTEFVAIANIRKVFPEVEPVN